MILNELLAVPVFDEADEQVGSVVDVRFVIDGMPRQLLADARLYGLLVGRHSHHSFMGYERTGETRPAGIARFLKWRERGSFLVLWEDVHTISAKSITLRRGYRRYSPTIDRS